MSVISIPTKFGPIRPLYLAIAATFASLLQAFAGTNGIVVEPDSPQTGRWTVTTPAYRMVVNLESPRIDTFDTGDYSLINGGVGLAPTINTGAPWGPAEAAIQMETPEVAHIVLYGMRWEDQLKGDIQVHFFCYPTRVVARLDVIPRAAPPTLVLGWVGEVPQAAPFPTNEDKPDWVKVLGVDGKLAPAALLLPPLRKGEEGRRRAHVRIDRGVMVNAQFVHYAHDIGTRSIDCTLVAAEDKAGLLKRLAQEVSLRHMQFDVENGRYLGYDARTGIQRFIMKPGPEAMSIVIPAHAGDRGPFLAAVKTQRNTPVNVTGSPTGSNVYWLPQTFDPENGGENGPGAYVIPFETGAESYTLRLQRMDASE